MVFSEIAAATLIAVYGLKNSYRIILRGERAVRRKIHRPAPAIAGYETFPRFFIRRIFRAGLVIAMRWEGRAKNAAQLAADARVRARNASDAVAKRAETVRTAAHTHAQEVRQRAANAKQRAAAAKDSMVRLRDDVHQRLSKASTTKASTTKVSTPAGSPRKPFSTASAALLGPLRPLGLSAAVARRRADCGPLVRTRFA